MKIKRILCAALAALTLAPCLSGCWDQRELNTILLITGVGLDAAKDDEKKIDVTLQIFQVTPKTGKESSGGEGGTSPMVLDTEAETFVGALTEFSRENYHQLLLQHNQVLLLGADLAEKGVADRLDVFTRNQESRMEVSLMVVDGKAREALTAELEQDKVTGIFLARTMNLLAQKSIHYRVRMLDFATRLLDGSTAPIAPIIQVAEAEKGQEIKLAGLAVFKKDKMVGRLDDEETSGYIWAMGSVKGQSLSIVKDEKKAAFHVGRMDSKRTVTLGEDGKVSVKLDISADVNLSELAGFEAGPPSEVITQLTEMVQEDIQEKILKTFEKALEMNTDIYGIGTDVSRKYPKKWKDLKERWDEVFPESACTVTVRADVRGTGQVMRSMAMEEEKNENGPQ